MIKMLYCKKYNLTLNNPAKPLPCWMLSYKRDLSWVLNHTSEKNGIWWDMHKEEQKRSIKHNFVYLTFGFCWRSYTWKQLLILEYEIHALYDSKSYKNILGVSHCHNVLKKKAWINFCHTDYNNNNDCLWLYPCI